MKLNRRVFMGSGAAAATALAAPMAFAGGHGKPRVVVVGGGAGGATAARYIVFEELAESIEIHRSQVLATTGAHGHSL